MAKIITQLNIFDYSEIEHLGDLERFYLCIAGIDDSELVKALKKQRKNGRNDYSVEVMLNLYYAFKTFSHQTIESFRRELLRNSDLRKACGLHDNSMNKKYLVPEPRVFSGFIKNLIKHQDLLDKIFNKLVDDMYNEIEGFGEILAGDGKIIQSYAKKKKKEIDILDIADGRKETDANYTSKEYHYTDKSGKEKVKKQTYFGFRAHIICDVKTELPIAMTVTKASSGERVEMIKMMDKFTDEQKNKMKYMLLDKGYDSLEMLKNIIDCNAKPIVDKRNMWSNKNETRQYKETDIVYDVKGNVFYIDDITLKPMPMKYIGYDKDRDALRYEYKGKIYRIKRTENERIFTPLARTSKKFKRIYKGRTAVERLNGRLDRDYMFEVHSIRGLKKMNAMVKLSGIIMLAMAKAHIDKKQKNYASLYKFA